jgi:hypothetical protein
MYEIRVLTEVKMSILDFWVTKPTGLVGRQDTKVSEKHNPIYLHDHTTLKLHLHLVTKTDKDVFCTSKLFLFTANRLQPENPLL